MTQEKEVEELIELVKKNKIFSPPYKDVSMAEGGKKFIIGYLVFAGKATAGELAKKLNVSTARIAVIINKLEESNIIIRKKDDIDKRISVITLSEKGILYAKEIDRFQYKLMESFVNEIGYENAKEFFECAIVLKNKCIDLKKEIDLIDKVI